MSTNLLNPFERLQIVSREFRVLGVGRHPRVFGHGAIAVVKREDIDVKMVCGTVLDPKEFTLDRSLPDIAVYLYMISPPSMYLAEWVA